MPEALKNDQEDRVPGFPGAVIGDFRVYAISNQVILWTVLSVVFALIIWKLEKPRAIVAAAAGSSRSALPAIGPAQRVDWWPGSSGSGPPSPLRTWGLHSANSARFA